MASTTTVDIEMPQMGESVTEGTVLEWHKNEGDFVEEGETIVEVSTDKVDAEVPAPSSGTIAKILKQADEDVKVGEVLAQLTPGEDGAASEPAAPRARQDDSEEADGSRLVEGGGEGDEDLGEDEGPTESPQPGVEESPAPSADPAAPGSEAEEADGGGSISGESAQLTMPEMGESVTEGTVLEWHKQEGESFTEGDTLVEVSTDKVDAEVPAPGDGTIAKILKQPDETVKVGEALAELSLGAGSAGSDPEGRSEAPHPEGSDPSVATEPAPTGNGKASPVARRVAAAKGVDLTNVTGTGVGGKITKDDVLMAAGAAQGNGAGAAAPAAAAPPADGKTKPLRGPAGMLAKAMNESRSMPTATSFRTLPVDVLDAKRKALNGVLKERGMKVSFTHLVAWAIVRAAAEDHPSMARTYAEQDGKPTLVDHGQVNLGIAVDVERKGERSLMVPCVKGADAAGFEEFRANYEDLITKTRENKLTADDFQGTNITLTNPGGIGTVASVPRLMTGQGTIVATGSIAYPTEWAHAQPEKIRSLGISKVMTMTSTYDHRIIQGAESGAFLRRIEQLLLGEDGFYEQIAQDLEISPSVVTKAHPASHSAPPIEPGGVTQPTTVTAQKPDSELLQAVQAATSLLKAYRTHGHLAAHLDPLGSEPKGDPAIQPENLNLTPELMAEIPAEILRIGVEGETLLDALPRMRSAYCGTAGYQMEHLSSHQQRMWLREMIETSSHRKPLSDDEKRQLLHRLLEVFVFERFIQKAYLGQKMFSIEGLDATVPMLDEIATFGQRHGAHEIVLGMAHRGRLSVLAHNFGRSVESIFAEFEGAKAFEAVKAVTAIPHGGTGDVKYHHGAEGMFETRDGEQIKMRLYPNPSHLEFVDPVVEGATRAEQTQHQGPKLHHNPESVVPVLLHGDAAFPGQGVVAETLNLQSLDGYTTGGTIHIIQNNQVGFTTDPTESRSTPYAADMAKGFNIPIIHVNADDVEACISATRLAMEYRREWGRDVVIDLIGYRRYGHNESDEPAYTQPKMAKTIKDHPPVSEIYAEKLVKEGVISPDDVEEEAKSRREQHSSQLKELRVKIEAGDYEDPSSTAVGTGELDRSKSPEVETAVSEKRLRTLNQELLDVPESFNVHRKLRKPLFRRDDLLEEGPVEFGHAEALAFATLLTEGTHIRLTGQDTERGTFSHRHLILHDENTGLEYSPIQNLSGALAPFELYNSPLSEIACVGFEYGYAAASPESLVLWEAQFGDFANSAQVIIDSFIVSGEAKWGQTSRLTLLLPHGYEGSGPEHSSARIERFLALGAEGNIRIANPTTAAQYFHLLRRQARIAKARPLVVFTPKGLLRLEAAASKLSDLTDGSFHFVLDDPRAEGHHDEIERLVLCSGKIYYDLDASEHREKSKGTAVARVELLYPFAKNQLAELIASYPSLKEIVWAQEEPMNMGAYKVFARRLPELIPDGVEFSYVGRPQRAAPSEGYPAAHRSEQQRIVLTALHGPIRPQAKRADTQI
jgi:2-oxoglutarate decarboxylase